MARSAGHTLYLTDRSARLALLAPPPRTTPTTNERPAIDTALLDMEFVGASGQARVTGSDRRRGSANYFLGNDSSRWRSGVPVYERVKYAGLYEGIDLVFYGNEEHLEYDFVLAPGASPSAIRLRFRGARRISIDPSGDLLIATPTGELRQRAPDVYQVIEGRRTKVNGRYRLVGAFDVGFEVDAFDTLNTLIIDPVISYSTYLGGNRYEFGYGVTTGPDGAVFVTGYTASTDFPTSPGVAQSMFGGYEDIFVTKLDPRTGDVLFSTYIGGTSSDGALSIAVDAIGNVYLSGGTNSSNFPTTPNRLAGRGPSVEMVVVKLSPDGSSLLFSTYLGGTGREEGVALAIDDFGHAFVTAYTSSPDMPTLNPLQNTKVADGTTDAYVAKIDTVSGTLVFATYLGGLGTDFPMAIAVNPDGQTYISGYTHAADFPVVNPVQGYSGGSDVFVSMIDASGTSLLYSTYLGGSADEQAPGLALDSSGAIYLSGYTSSTNYPVVNPYSTDRPGVDAFITKLSASGIVSYSTYLGGSSSDYGYSLAVDASGQANLVGTTASLDFPSVAPLQPRGGGPTEAFVAKLAADGSSLLFSTYLGGSGQDTGRRIARDADGRLYVAGETRSLNFPTRNPFQGPTADWNVFVTGIELTTLESVSPSVDVAAGGASVTLTGSGFAPGLMVTFGDTPSDNVEFLDQHTVRATAPPHALGTVDIVVRNQDGTTGRRTEAFTYGSDGDGDGIPDLGDNCPNHPNADQADDDRDGSGNVCDTNTAPAAENGALAAVEDTPATGNLVASDYNGDPLTFSIASNGQKGTAIITDAVTGAYSYMPHLDATGTDTFTFVVSDGQAVSSPATITVTITAVNDAPRAQEVAVTGLEDFTTKGTLKATDPEGSAVTYSIADAPTRGVVTITNASTGAFAYKPLRDVNGTDQFTFRASDGSLLSDPATVTVTVTPVNDPPRALNASAVTKVNIPVTNILRAFDVDGDPLTFTITTMPSNGTVVLNTSTGEFTYTPNAGFAGSNYIYFRVNDGTISSPNIGRFTVTVKP